MIFLFYQKSHLALLGKVNLIVNPVVVKCATSLDKTLPLFNVLNFKVKVQPLPLTDGVAEDSTPRKVKKYFPNSELSFIAFTNVSAALLLEILTLEELVVVPVEEKLRLEEEKLLSAKLNLTVLSNDEVSAMIISPALGVSIINAELFCFTVFIIVSISVLVTTLALIKLILTSTFFDSEEVAILNVILYAYFCVSINLSFAAWNLLKPELDNLKSLLD